MAVMPHQAAWIVHWRCVNTTIQAGCSARAVELVTMKSSDYGKNISQWLRFRNSLALVPEPFIESFNGVAQLNDPWLRKTMDL
jgi:hypothetical protein